MMQQWLYWPLLRRLHGAALGCCCWMTWTCWCLQQLGRDPASRCAAEALVCPYLAA
jgi:hypothetical protein